MGHKCPDDQTLHRVAWAYYVFHENDKYHLVPPECLDNESTFAAWLVKSVPTVRFAHDYKFLNLWDLALKYCPLAYSQPLPDSSGSPRS